MCADVSRRLRWQCALKTLCFVWAQFRDRSEKSIKATQSAVTFDDIITKMKHWVILVLVSTLLLAVITNCSEPPPDRLETNDRVEFAELLQKLSERLMMQDHDAEGDDFAREQISGAGAFNAPLTKLLQCHSYICIIWQFCFQKIISECASQILCLTKFYFS